VFRARSLVYIALAVALLAVCAWIALPAGEVAFTLQTLGVILVSILLTPAETIIALALYLALGLVGAPVFSRGAGGVAVLLGPSGGFLLGLLGMGATISLSGKLYQYKPLPLALGTILGSLLNYLCGTLWFCFVYSMQSTAFPLALAHTVLPFLLPDAAKGALGVFLGVKLRGRVATHREL